MSSRALFNKSLALTYLGLPDDYTPSPESDPIPFLARHLMQLPPHLLLHFSYITSAKERTALPAIRNRRLKYTNSNPSQIHFTSARAKWPNLWQGRERTGLEEGEDEKAWAENEFLGGAKKHVGKLGGLLGGYEEEREAERVRTLRIERAAAAQFIPEEDESSDEEEEAEATPDDDSPEEAKAWFERSVRERLIYGLLEPFDYDKVDWDESLDEEDEREAEGRWFDKDDEC
ncbi:hypothetical protein E4T56_gene16257 [Termitomyces sp. T112]|nr:hypothetical protein E4T56_gene16257 [Termitomyces sp. T112]KAH0587758.1 hypothetical protein H2248_006516 [Termitomyces sp. 'cryptogamus']